MRGLATFLGRVIFARMSLKMHALRRLAEGAGAIIVETRCLSAAYGTTHAVEVDEHGTALRVLCGTVPLKDIGITRYVVPTCPQCVRVDALPVRCPETSPRWFALELRRTAAEPWKNWHDAKEKAERDAEAERAEAERALADAAEEKRQREGREKKEEQRAWSKWKHEQHLSLTAREREWAEILRRDWAQHGQEEEKEELIHSAPGDCGKKHLSDAAAFACRNVRLEEEERRARGARAARPPTPAPLLPGESSVAPRPEPVMSSSPRPAQPPVSSSPRPAQPAPRPAAPPVSSSPRAAQPALRPAAPPAPRPASVPAPRPALVPETSSSPRPAQPPPALHLRLVDTSAPRPPPASTGPEPPVNRTEALERRILDALSAHDLSSYRAILAHIGGNRAAALAVIQVMHDEGRIRLDDGVFRPGDDRAGRRVS